LEKLKSSLTKNQYLKEINLWGKQKKRIKIDNFILENGCIILNEILMENKTIETINLGSNTFSNKKKITIYHQ
jgi:hypothetical protein